MTSRRCLRRNAPDMVISAELLDELRVAETDVANLQVVKSEDDSICQGISQRTNAYKDSTYLPCPLHGPWFVAIWEE